MADACSENTLLQIYVAKLVKYTNQNRKYFLRKYLRYMSQKKLGPWEILVIFALLRYCDELTQMSEKLNPAAENVGVKTNPHKCITMSNSGKHVIYKV